MINDDKLAEFLESELEYVLKECYKVGTTYSEPAFKAVGNKTKMLLDVLSCRTASAAQVAAKDFPQATKKIILELFDSETLISEILNSKE